MKYSIELSPRDIKLVLSSYYKFKPQDDSLTGKVWWYSLTRTGWGNQLLSGKLRWVITNSFSDSDMTTYFTHGSCT